ncbi:MAG: U32 family peptidase [Oscillospiraceae bacterium]|nr:U32 family peptidase [Oscillospiraceae bacterium]
MKNNKYKIPELLAPAGSFDALCAAVQGGVDAVYFGGKTANARNAARNFTDEEIACAIQFLHDKDKLAYVTLNTLHTDREINPDNTGISELLKFAEHCYASGADAFILQDIGLSQIVRRYFPEIKLCASTQMSGHNTDSSRRLSELGFSRMVIARELDLENLQSLVANSPLEIEMFVHGALCSSHSGRCFMSFALGNTRSANRGMCAQPCRMQYRQTSYNNGYALSLKDLCLANHIEEIIKLSPASLKIEGRMKPPEYVYNVCKIYRTCLDENRNASKQEIDFLSKIFSRQGFTDGYFVKSLSSHMYGVRTDENKQESRDYAALPNTTRRGGSVWSPVKTEQISDGRPRVIAPTTELNPRKNIKITPKLCLMFNSYNQFAAVSEYIKNDEVFKRIYKIFLPLAGQTKIPQEFMKITGVKMPYVMFDSEREQIANLMKSTEINCAIIDNIGHIDIAKESGCELFGDFGLNVTNSYTLDEYKKMGFKDIILSPELNFAQIRDINKTANCGIIAYGRTHVIISENCLIKNSGACKINNGGDFCAYNSNFYLTDKTGAEFLVQSDFGHRSIIYNSVPVYLADKKDLYKNLGLFFIVLNFTDEKPDQIKKIIADYALNKDNIKPPQKFTRGYK